MLKGILLRKEGVQMRKLDPQFGTVTLANRLKFKRCPSVILESSASKNRVPLSLKNQFLYKPRAISILKNL